MPTQFTRQRLSISSITRLLRPLATIILLCLLPVTPTQAAETREFNDGPQRLSVSLPNGYQGRYGFHPVRVVATNSGNREVTWMVAVNERGMDESTLNGDGHLERITVGPRQTIEREFLVAIGRNETSIYWNNLQIEVIRPSGNREQWSPRDSSSGRPDPKGLDTPALITQRTYKSVSDAPQEDEGFHGWLDPVKASHDWRGYAGYSLIVLTHEDWQVMPVAARNAIGDWVRLGGHLQFIGETPQDAPSTDGGDSRNRSLGGVYPAPTFTNSNLRFNSLPGFLAAKRSNHPTSEALKTRESLISNWLTKIKSDLMSERFTIWPTVIVLIIFFIMMTPVNLFILAPSRRRHKLFRTIPIISLAACVLLAIAVVVGDGFGGEGRRLIHIESRAGTENRQYITQWQASRCGALIGTGFTIDDAAYIAPLRAPGGQVSLTVSGDQVDASGGWFTSRATQSQILQTARPGRGRIEWSHRNDQTTAVSTFDFPLQDIYILDENQQWWHAPQMKQGEAVTPQQVSKEMVKTVLDQRLDRVSNEKSIRSLSHRPGHYIAFTDQPPAIETLNSVDWEDTGIITGQLAKP